MAPQPPAFAGEDLLPAIFWASFQNEIEIAFHLHAGGVV
jgi:hypothetical protein